MIQGPDDSLATARPTAKAALHPFRRAVLRGLAVVSPPLFTILIFAWVLTTTEHYVLQPVTHGVRAALVWSLSDIKSNLPPTTPGGRRAVYGQQTYYGLDKIGRAHV